MIALVALVAGIVSGLGAGGSVKRLSTLRLRGEIVLVVTFVVQGVARGRLLGTVPSTWGLAIWVGSSVALVGLLVANGGHPGAIVAAVGTLLNVIVVLANGAMPIVLTEGIMVESAKVAAASGGFYQLAQPGMLVVWAGDAFRLSVLGQTYFLSVGDVLLCVGVAVLIAAATLPAPGSGHATLADAGGAS